MLSQNVCLCLQLLVLLFSHLKLRDHRFLVPALLGHHADYLNRGKVNNPYTAPTNLGVAVVLFGQLFLIGLQHLHLLLHLLLFVLELAVLLDELDSLVGHLGELGVDGDVLPDGPLGRLGHLLVADLAELGRHLVHAQDHLFLQPL
ncbi:hypothetical protein EGW08_016666 [Elysia chlorotica]|uniref:Uncharacterized protein n=1 Tax=Elysia chlorotica TaxID=188477 RepID=A0A3S1AYP7_ELYCH|nr:hypothetical protein EGW08_016666 [Elysia chlorotica]